MNIHPFINHNITTSILMYVHGCNWKLCNRYVLLYSENIKKISHQAVPNKQKKAILYKMCPITPRNEGFMLLHVSQNRIMHQITPQKKNINYEF